MVVTGFFCAVVSKTWTKVEMAVSSFVIFHLDKKCLHCGIGYDYHRAHDRP